MSRKILNIIDFYGGIMSEIVVSAASGSFSAINTNASNVSLIEFIGAHDEIEQISLAYENMINEAINVKSRTKKIN